MERLASRLYFGHIVDTDSAVDVAEDRIGSQNCASLEGVEVVAATGCCKQLNFSRKTTCQQMHSMGTSPTPVAQDVRSH